MLGLFFLQIYRCNVSSLVGFKMQCKQYRVYMILQILYNTNIHKNRSKKNSVLLKMQILVLFLFSYQISEILVDAELLPTEKLSKIIENRATKF